MTAFAYLEKWLKLTFYHSFLMYVNFRSSSCCDIKTQTCSNVSKQLSGNHLVISLSLTQNCPILCKRGIWASYLCTSVTCGNDFFSLWPWHWIRLKQMNVLHFRGEKSQSKHHPNLQDMKWITTMLWSPALRLSQSRTWAPDCWLQKPSNSYDTSGDHNSVFSGYIIFIAFITLVNIF